MNQRFSDDPQARSGRTTMEALHIVQLSLDNPGKWIEIDDHYQKSPDGDRLMLHLVESVLRALCVPYDKHGYSIRTIGPPTPFRYPETEKEILDQARKYSL